MAIMVDHGIFIIAILRYDPHDIGRHRARPHARRQPLTHVHADIDILVRWGSIAPQPVRDLSALVIIEAAEHLRHDGMLAGAEARLINIDHARYAEPYRATLRAERLAIAPHNVNFEPHARPRH
jgi:hypothetical protein